MWRIRAWNNCNLSLFYAVEWVGLNEKLGIHTQLIFVRGNLAHNIIFMLNKLKGIPVDFHERNREQF